MARCRKTEDDVDLVEGPAPDTLACPKCGDVLDASTCQTVPSNSILTETADGTYYTGPLDPAAKALRDEYGDSITARIEGGRYFVGEHRNDSGVCNQWGVGRTEEEAWRYFIGADFGPLDDTYVDEGYEAHQRASLGLPPL